MHKNDLDRQILSTKFVKNPVGTIHAILVEMAKDNLVVDGHDPRKQDKTSELGRK